MSLKGLRSPPPFTTELLAAVVRSSLVPCSVAKPKPCGGRQKEGMPLSEEGVLSSHDGKVWSLYLADWRSQSGRAETRHQKSSSSRARMPSAPQEDKSLHVTSCVVSGGQEDGRGVSQLLQTK